MAKNKGGSYTPPTRAEIEAMRAEKMQLVPSGEAGRRERKLLEHYGAAKDDLQWIVDNNAWHDLGFDTFTTWYSARVRPAVAAAGLRPTQEFALYVLDNVQSDEAALPKQQRLLQRELADLVGVSVSTLRRLSQDPSQTSNGAGADLEDATEPDPADIPEALTEAIRETAASVGAGVAYLPAFTESRCPETVDPKYCANGCGTPISWSDSTGGHLRCRKCDPSSLHHAIPNGDDWLPQCKYCTEISGSGDGPSPVAGSGPQTAAEGADTTEADGAQDVGASSGRSLSRPATAPAPDGGAASSPSGVNPEERTGEPKLIGCPLCVYRVEVSPVDPDVSVDEMYGHLTRTHDLGELEAEEALAKVGLTYSPAADEMPHIPTAGASPTLAPQQPGQDSPTGRGRVSHEGRAAEAPDRSETDSSAGPDREGRPASTGPSIAVATTVLPGVGHHEPDAGSGSGEAPEAAASVEPGELEDGDAAVTPSSSDPELLLQLFAAILQALDRVDVGALAPLLLTDEMQQLHEAADRVATFVGLLETWRTP